MIILIAGAVSAHVYYAKSLKPPFPLLRSAKAGLLLLLHFIPVAVSGLWSSNTAEWLHWVQLKLPYLFLPLGFLFLPKLERKTLHLIYFLFISVLSVSAVLVLINYLLHFDTITASFLRGNGIPMPFSHIRYTLMLVFSFFLSGYLLTHVPEYGNSKYLKPALITTAIFLFIAIHVFSVRSSLLALYAGLLFTVGRYIWVQQKYVTGILLVVAIALIPFIAYQTVPSFHNKVRFMVYDWQQFKAGNINTLNDAMRVVSIDVGWNVFKKQPWLGTGAGDLRDACMQQYEQQYPQTDNASRMLPHNQFVWVLASLGVFGFSLFIVGLLGPFLYGTLYRLYPAVILYIILLLSILVEHTLEEQIGSGFYILWTLLFLNQDKE